MFDQVSKTDQVMLGGAVVMAGGTLFPIFKLPMVGSLNYFMNGQGNGVLIIFAAVGMVAATLYAYRKIAALLALASLMVMGHTIVGLIVLIQKAQAGPKDAGSFDGLAKVMASSVGFEWGWIPLLGGAMTVLIAGMMSGGLKISVPGTGGPGPSEDEFSPDKADAAIARYLESQRMDARTSATPTSFGKRQRV